MPKTQRLLKRFDLPEEEIERKLNSALEGTSDQDLEARLFESVKDIKPGTMIIATVESVDDHTKTVVMGFGGKSEGHVPLSEFGEALPEAGQEFEVFYEGEDAYQQTANISKRRADRLRAWERVSVKYNEGDEINGVVMRKIKGGLLVDVEGVNVFLPASQVNLRRTHDIAAFIDEPVRARIIKIDPERMNIVVSRRKLLEEERQRLKENLLEEITEKQVRTGVVKNIADFGVFVDLGGIDGLLHITDMSWGRINHPSKMVEMDQEIEVMVLRVDRDRERIALGLKQLCASPWDGIEGRYPLESVQKGEVVNIMSYGAFVKLEDGIEGLVHISEMSWTRRINHPSELVTSGQEVDVVVLAIDHEKQEISLGMKQAEANPWDLVDEHYPAGTVIEGSVRNLTSYGAFVEIEEGIDGLLHVSDMSWTKKVTHPSEVVKKGDKVQCAVLSADKEKKRIALGMKQLSADPWLDDIPNKFHVGDLLSGFVTKTTSFGAFVKLDDELEGLLHISELSDTKVDTPEDVLRPGMKAEVRVIRVDIDERKIGLSFVHADFEENEGILGEQAADETPETAETASAPEGSDQPAAADEQPAPEAPADEPQASEVAAPEAEATASEAATETEPETVPETVPEAGDDAETVAAEQTGTDAETPA
ncbi:MAG: 30S ribosomal protein S1 [Planctomycetota bacterium]|jgi:small subunit ribosomal protein S1|nr:30S ribosomal protein S1 [Planctomycetota bacterium]MDP6761508.1 30S ribosomal protein S1 [Planctomycetota bacterium]MDP6989491.1 30S ribosomal protein S1 [Planctomycetota bacterium]